MEKSKSIRDFRNKINKLPSDEPLVREHIWYTTQKQHWLGWLEYYNGPGAYGRKGYDHDAKFAYNHVVCPQLLLYLTRAIPLSEEIIQQAEEAEQAGVSEMQKAGNIRKVVSWSVIYEALWGKNSNDISAKS